MERAEFRETVSNLTKERMLSDSGEKYIRRLKCIIEC